MYQSNLNSRSLRSALLLGATSFAALSLAGPAMAQDQSVETVVVTGSRIPQQGLYASSPVTAVGQQEMKLEGTTKVENLLNSLPGVFADFGSTDSNGSTGQATVNLRNLGSSRTLVLVNGTRLMPGDPSNPVADLNNIPSALVDHVEVLTGGASAVYGSDALAGVVNFVMRKDFEGVEIDGQYSVNNAANGHSRFDNLNTSAGYATAPKDWWGGSSADATLILGTNTPDGKGNITAYLSYRNVQPVLQSKRDFSACAIGVFQAYQACIGSSNKNRFISVDNGNTSYYLRGDGTSGSGHLVPWGSVPSSEKTYNYGPLNYLQRPDERYSGGFFAHYQVNKAFDVYSSFMFADDHTLAQIAPSGAFWTSGPTTNPATGSPGYVEMNCSNPLMTAQENQVLCGGAGSSLVTTGPIVAALGHSYYDGAGNITPGLSLLKWAHRNLEGGPRVDDLRHTSYRMKVGAKGDLGHGWSYDVYGQYGLTLYSETYDNEWSMRRTQNALLVNPLTGNCYAAENTYDAGGHPLPPTDTNCVPLDIFNGFGSISPAAESYVSAQGFKQGWTQEQILSGSVTGDLGEWGVQSPWAQSPVALAVGAEYRSEQLLLKTSRDFQINDLYGQGGATLPVPRSGFNVAEGFGELRIPVIQGMPMAEDLSINAGYRYSSYSSVGSVSSWKVGAEWQPIDDFRLRASYNRSTRAPNVLETYSPFNIALFGGSDPCASVTTGPCALVPNAGNTAIIKCPAAQCNAGYGGNTSLKAETSTTASVGVVFTPTFIDGFTATIDYWDIKVDDYVGRYGANTILNGCYTSGSASQQAFFCPLVHRAANGSLTGGGYVENIQHNLPFLKTSGIDFEANYQTDMGDWGLDGWGALSFNFVGTLLNNLETKSSKFTSSYDCKGYYGLVCYTPSPEWRHKLRVTWSSPWDFDVSLLWRHMSGVNLDANTHNSLLGGGAPLYGVYYACAAGLGGVADCLDNHIPSFDWFDLSGTWTVREGVQLRAGVTNLFDKTPPAMDSAYWGVSGPPFGNGNTYPGVYDSLGRTFFVGATIKY